MHPARIRALGLTGLSAALAAGECLALEAASAYLDAAVSDEGRLNAYRIVLADQALRAAQASDHRRSRGERLGPLDGLPLAIKDNIDLAGAATTGGLACLAHNYAVADAAIVQLLRQAGAVILGKTGMDEAALGATGANATYGDCHNPLRRGYITGGSSSGSAAAVAGELAAAALGTDTLGSVRLPAAFCGLVGFKPGWGTLPTAGILPLSPRLDAPGFLARSVEDAALLWEVMRLPSDAKLGSLSVLRPAGLRRDVAAALASAVQALSSQGLEVEQLQTNDLDLATARKAAMRVIQGDLWAAHGALFTAAPDSFSPALRSHLRAGRDRSAGRTEAARRSLDDWSGRIAALLRRHPFLLLPTTWREAVPHGHPQHDDEGDLTALASIARLPAISVPAGVGEIGLPLGLQLVGRRGCEAGLLGMARALSDELHHSSGRSS